MVFHSRTSLERGYYEATLDGKTSPYRLLTKDERVGGHITLSPDGASFIELSGHRTIWVFPSGSRKPFALFEFGGENERIDYPVWSPSGKWVLFDRMVSQGGDIYLVDGLE